MRGNGGTEKEEGRFVKNYMTRQRRAILAYLDFHPDETLSVRQIADAMQAENVSLSSVYRNLAGLEAEGVVRRESRDGIREACYRYADAERCRDCLHLSCKKCGRTFHMDSVSAARMLDEVDRTTGFQVDRRDTVLYGICRDCRE